MAEARAGRRQSSEELTTTDAVEQIRARLRSVMSRQPDVTSASNSVMRWLNNSPAVLAAATPALLFKAIQQMAREGQHDARTEARAQAMESVCQTPVARPPARPARNFAHLRQTDSIFHTYVIDGVRLGDCRLAHLQQAAQRRMASARGSALGSFEAQRLIPLYNGDAVATLSSVATPEQVERIVAECRQHSVSIQFVPPVVTA